MGREAGAKSGRREIVDKTALIEQIASAFATVEYPGDWCLIGSNEGSEPAYTAEAFKGKTDRYAIEAKFLDDAPEGLRSALSFFSDEAFHFYLPAYMIADIRGQLEEVDLVFHLIHGIDNKSPINFINPRRYGRSTWFDAKCYKFSIFTKAEAAAIVAYLKFKRDTALLFEQESIDRALNNYWNERIS